MEQIRLNIGAGSTQIPGFTPLDIKDGQPAYPLKYADASVEEIYASHVLEHIPHTETVRCLAEWVRVLKPGGVLRIAVPDATKIMAMDDMHPLKSAFLMGGQTDEHDYHKAVFTFRSLERKLSGLGMEGIKSFEPTVEDCSRWEISLNVECRKRMPFAVKNDPKIVAVMSVHTLGFTATMNLVATVLAPMGIELNQVGGAYWEKSLTHAMRDAIAKGADYVLTVDHDGAFTREDVEYMIDVMQKRTDLAVLFPVQMSRHDFFPLVFQRDLDYSTELTIAPFGHFGLTLIRTDMLKKLPTPWLWSMPDPNTNDWGGPYDSDADITFWRSMKEQGYKAAQANRVMLGHILQAIKLPDAVGGSRYQTVANFMANGPYHPTFDQEVYRKRYDEEMNKKLEKAGIKPPAPKAVELPKQQIQVEPVIEIAPGVTIGTDIPEHPPINGAMMGLMELPSQYANSKIVEVPMQPASERLADTMAPLSDKVLSVDLGIGGSLAWFEKKNADGTTLVSVPKQEPSERLADTIKELEERRAMREAANNSQIKSHVPLGAFARAIQDETINGKV